MSPIPRSATNGDRYIPLRDENRWTNKFAITVSVFSNLQCFVSECDFVREMDR
jgi:hypothetical protein